MWKLGAAALNTSPGLWQVLRRTWLRQSDRACFPASAAASAASIPCRFLPPRG